MKSLFKNGLIWFLVWVLFSFMVPLGLLQTAYAVNLHHLEQKKRSKEQQIQQIRKLKHQILIKEKYVTYNIIQNQKRLDSSRSSLGEQQDLFQQNKGKLQQLEGSMDVILREQQKLAAQVGKRLRNIYMGERIGFLNALLDAGNITTMLDRFYYKKRIFAQDKKLYADFIAKTRQLEEQKNALVHEKNRLYQNIQKIQTYQDQLQEAMSLDKILVNKLKTSRQAYEMAEDQLQRESEEIERQILAVTKKGGAIIGSTGLFIRPVIAAITSPFGWRYHPIFHTEKFHSGIDFGAAYGIPIHAADGGKIIEAGWIGGYGKVVIINHGTIRGKNFSTLYGHMSRVAVSMGQMVSKGQVVGYVGATGYATGPHLHFEVRINGRPVNPLQFLK